MSLKQRRMTNAGDRAVSLHEGLDEAMDDVQSGRSVMGDHHWSLAVHADSLAELHKAAGEIKSVLANTSVTVADRRRSAAFRPTGHRCRERRDRSRHGTATSS